jgi:hypothetical protein
MAPPVRVLFSWTSALGVTLLRNFSRSRRIRRAEDRDRPRPVSGLPRSSTAVDRFPCWPELFSRMRLVDLQIRQDV